MTVRYGKFEMPEGVEVDSEGLKPTFARFVAEPFERGYGHTLGSSLRRMMLTSLEAPAVVSVRIDGVSHEYMAVEGIIEDMTNIILNFKEVLLRQLPREGDAPARTIKRISATIEVTDADLKEGGGQKEITLSDVIGADLFEVVNPELHLFTVTQPMKRKIDVRIATGRGYVPTERLELPDKVVDEIAVDALFSPVRLVNYRVENTRVGQDTDYDRLILEVTTDGRVTPQEALAFAAQIGKKHLDPFGNVEEREVVFQKEEALVNTDREEMLAKLCQKIGEIELSVRSTNCLNGAGIRYIGELVTMREGDMLRFRNFGKKSLSEIREKLDEMELGFNMDLSEYGITAENVGPLIEEYLEARGTEIAEVVEMVDMPAEEEEEGDET